MNATKSAVSRTRVFAIFAVMALVFCSFAAVFTAESEAAEYSSLETVTGTGPNQEFSLDISTGQQFSYQNITTSLDAIDGTQGNITFQWTGDAVSESGTDGIAWNEEDRTLSGVFTTGEGTTRSGTLTATWTYDPSDDGNTITQTATQKINFIISQALSVVNSIASHIKVDTPADTPILTIDYTGSGDIDMTVSGADPTNGITGTPFKATSTASTITISTAEAIDEADVTTGSYTFDIVLTNQDTNDTATVEVTVYIYEEIAITNTQYNFYTFEGDKESSFLTSGINVEVNYANDSDDNTISNAPTMVFDPVDSILSQNSEDKYQIDITGVGNATMGTLVGEDDTSKTYQATVTVTGDLTDSDGNESTTTSEDSMTFYLHVYKALEFTQKPSVATIDTTPIGGTASNTALLSTYITGAKSVVFDWGDGYRTSNMKTDEVSSNYTSTHSYAAPGTYLITVYATNDMGTTTSKIMYTAGGEGALTPDEPVTDDGDKSFIDEHGWIFIVFIALAAFCVVGYLFIMPQHPVWIIGLVVCAILAVLTFVYVDFNGIADAIGGLFGSEE